MAGYRDVSFTALWARIGHPVDQALLASGHGRTGVTVLPEAERAALAAGVAPRLAEFEALRVQTLATVDRRARWMVPLAGIAALAAVLAGGWGVVSAAVFGLLAAVVGWFIAIGRRAERYQEAVRRGLGASVLAHVLEFQHVPEPVENLARVRDWRLFPELQSARTLGRSEGEFLGRPVSLSEMAIAYAPGRRTRSPARSSMPDDVLCVSVIETQWPAGDGLILTLTPTDAPARILHARHHDDLQATGSGDASFDRAYVLRCSGDAAERMLTPAVRASILAMHRIELPGRPYLSVGNGRLAVLFPLGLSNLAFHVPPYWVPIDADGLMARFAEDLVLRRALMRSVLELPESWQQRNDWRGIER